MNNRPAGRVPHHRARGPIPPPARCPTCRAAADCDTGHCLHCDWKHCPEPAPTAEPGPIGRTARGLGWFEPVPTY